MSKISINDVLNTLKGEFLVNLPDRINEIEDLILNLPNNKDIENLLRAVHSLKGVAGTHGFHVFTKICHQMEDMMQVLIGLNKINSQSAMATLLAYNDLHKTALAIVNNQNDNFGTIEVQLQKLSLNVSNQQRKVLLVEPSTLYSTMISAILIEHNCQVKVVQDGLVALENMLMQTYDDVISAMETPTLNGEALLSAIRISKGKNRNINAILITTQDSGSIKYSEFFNHIINRNSIKDGFLPDLLSK